MAVRDWQCKYFSLLRLGAFIIIVLFQSSCANESAPQGGKKDEKPPKAKKSYPANKTLHFNSDKIQITFDEYIKATGFSQTLISPPLEKQPDFKIKGKTLTIKLKSPLRDSTTYTINFADDIKDVNEGNTATNFTYVFSTGSYIDSQKISGKVILAKDNSTSDGIVVALYPEDSVDAITRSKPFYFAKTDKSGLFQINNIKAGNYQVYALKDQNYNYIYDQPNEMIGFSDSIMQLNDSFPKKAELSLFDENKKRIGIDGTNSTDPGFMQVYYNKPIQSLKLDSKQFADGDFWYFNETKDTINYWHSKYYVKRDTLFLIANDSIRDTVRIDLKFIDKDSLATHQNYSLSIVNQSNNSINDTSKKSIYNVEELYKPLKINFTRPVTGINEGKQLRIMEDSAQNSIAVKFSLDEKTKQFISIGFDKKENTPYSLEIPDSAFRDIFGMWNRKTVYKFQTNGKDNYGNIHLTLKTENPEKYYLIKLLNSNNEMVKEFSFSGDNEKKVSIDNVLAGSYKFIVIDDRNRNGKWDTGDFKNKIQPEKVFTIKDTYQLKGGWDLDVEVKF